MKDLRPVAAYRLVFPRVEPRRLVHSTVVRLDDVTVIKKTTCRKIATSLFLRNEKLSGSKRLLLLINSSRVSDQRQSTVLLFEKISWRLFSNLYIQIVSPENQCLYMFVLLLLNTAA